MAKKLFLAIVLLTICFAATGCAKKVTVSFETNGGNPIASMLTPKGSVVTLPEAVREGYFFGGWFPSNSLGATEFSSYNIIEKSMTLYARWYTLEQMVSQLKYTETETGVEITGYNGTPSLIVIPQTIENKRVVSIKDLAFTKLSTLTRVEILSGLSDIGEDAFSDCLNLVTVKLPDSVKNIGKMAFYHCITLVNINLPAYLEKVSPGLFLDCISLETVDVPYGVTEVSDSAFAGCLHLKTVTIPKTVTIFGKDVFQDCNRMENIYTDDDNIKALTDLMAPGNRNYIKYIHSR